MKIKKYWLFVLVFTLFFLILYMFCNFIAYDEFWNFSFSYNISRGYLPYKDFNMIITPLYPLLIGIFLKIPLNKYLLYLIINSFFAANIVYLSREKKDNYLITILLLTFLIPFTYNSFILILYYLLIKYDKNDKLSGLLVGLIFLTKQNIGICFLIVMLIISKNRFKRFIYFLIPNIIFLVYLIASNSLKEFINLGFLGLFEFANKNTAFNLDIIILFLINFIVIIYYSYKTKFKDHQFLYLIALQMIAIPIMEIYHIFTASIPLYSYIVNKIKDKKVLKVCNAFSVILIVILLCITLEFKNVPNNTKIFKYRNIGSNDYYYEIKEFVRNNDNYNYIFISPNTTYLKEELNLEPSPFDIPLYGNIGKNGKKDFIRYIGKVCVEECFIIIDDSSWQINKEVIEHVKNNYKLYDKNIYTNIIKN